jgi:molecular chaperone GrpE
MSEPELTNDKPNGSPGAVPDVAASPESGVAAAGADAAAAGAPAADLTPQLEALRKERDDLYSRYLRAVADLDNYRRRVIRENDEVRQYAVSRLVESLLPIFENLRLAIASAQQTPDPAAIAKGVGFVLEQFRTALAGVGLAEINPAVGDTFDPHQHESIAHAPSDKVPEEAIVQVARCGFALNGRIVRPASVVLSSGPAAPAAS